jgi:methylated-DNA-[protein]-cysteine S-methyltransferase
VTALTEKAELAMIYAELDSPIGRLALVEDDGGLAGLLLPSDRLDGQPAFRSSTGLAGPLRSLGQPGQNAVLEQAAGQLEEYFAGTRQVFDLPLNPPGSAFQHAVWQALRQIPYGRTATYGAIGRRIGQPKAARAVGQANNRNPLAVIVPCHRVIGAAGDLTGYRGGLETKRWLLAHERAHA